MPDPVQDSATQTASVWKYMDSRGWWESLPNVTFISCYPGDVFVVKCYDGIPGSTTEAIIRAGQAVLSRASNGSSNSEHALILLDPATMRIAEAAGPDIGLRQAPIRGGDFTVHRCKNTTLREKVVEVTDYFTKSSPGFT